MSWRCGLGLGLSWLVMWKCVLTPETEHLPPAFLYLNGAAKKPFTRPKKPRCCFFGGSADTASGGLGAGTGGGGKTGGSSLAWVVVAGFTGRFCAFVTGAGAGSVPRKVNGATICT